MATKTRGSETAGDVVRTCLVFFGLLALVAGFFAINRPGPQLPDPVDYEGVVDTLRRDYPYRVMAPADVPDEWRATSVDHRQDALGHRWRLGFLIGEESFVQLEQSDGEIQSYTRDRLADFDEDGTTRLDGETWQRWIERDRQPDRALVHVADGVVTIVRGTTPYETLADFVTRME